MEYVQDKSRLALLSFDEEESGTAAVAKVKKEAPSRFQASGFKANVKETKSTTQQSAAGTSL